MRVRRLLPRGQGLPVDELRRRHRFMLALLWAHVAIIPVYALLQDVGFGHTLIEAGVVGLPALAATLAGDRHLRLGTGLVAVGLLTCSAVIVHLSQGYIEAHFHFFVMIVLLTLYEDWWPFGLAAGYVALHHGLGGVIDAGAVYNHADAIAHPWRWAAIHAVFVAAAGVCGIAAWRLNEDVREQKDAALRRAEAAEADLARSNRDLEEFAYVASHDLSEPLRTVSGFVELLQRRYEGKLDAQADEFINYAVDGTQRMRRMLDDLLELSRAGRGELHPQPVALGEVVDDVASSLRSAMADAGAKVQATGLPTVHADPASLSRVLQNLMANAVKFVNGRAPVVDVSAERADGQWIVSVADNGIGIDPGQADRVFKMFQRLHTREEFDGSGIGLSVCQVLVERHGGRIWVEDTPGGGATFRFTLPDAA